MSVDPAPYYQLTPAAVLDAVESSGRISDYRILALNSYENRVYSVGIENEQPVIAKFYRPGRWSDEQILEEHKFTLELFEADIPVVAPLANDEGNTLFVHGPFRFCLYPRVGGHTPELDNLETLYRLGQFMGRIHAFGETGQFAHRNTLSIESMVGDSVNLITEHFMPKELLPAFTSLSKDLLQIVEEQWAQADPNTFIRLHGDCHQGNILWHDDSPTFVDFDDAINGPAMQDLWMLLSGDRQQRLAQIAELAEGYDMFHTFPSRQLPLIETLRTMRMMYYSAWLARRWEDPSFQMNFPWFNTQRYWSDHILSLREQMAALNEPALTVW
ncbi:MAG: serine/threonine protein kinase [Pseudomonadales bacterium]